MRLRTWRTTAIIALVSATFAALVLAATGDERQRVEQVDLTELRLPLEQFMSSPPNEDRIARARVILVHRCLRGFGIDPPSGEAGDRHAAPQAGRNERRYGITDEKAAAAHGYREQRPASMPSLGSTRVSRAAQAVVFGTRDDYRGKPVPNGGCAARAERVLAQGANGDADAELAGRIALETLRLSERHPRVREGFEAWSACMNRSGFRYTTPWRPNDDPAFRTPKPTAREIATAVADARCKEQVGLVPSWVAAETAVQWEAIAHHRADLDRSKRKLTVMARNARRILRES